MIGKFFPISENKQKRDIVNMKREREKAILNFCFLVWNMPNKKQMETSNLFQSILQVKMKERLRRFFFREKMIGFIEFFIEQYY